MSDHIPDATKMVCPHCKSPARDDWPSEYRCASVNLSGRVTRSPVCFGNEIAQLKAKVLRLMQAGNALADFHSFATVQAWNIAKEDK